MKFSTRAFQSKLTPKLIAYSAMLMALIFSGQTFAYTPPTGIPDPTWGTIHPIDTTAPSQPSSWPATVTTGYYYIDNTSLAATDSGNPYGTPNKPRSSIPYTLSAGDYVEIHGGPYTGSQLTITANGTATNPVWIRGKDASSKPTIQTQLIINGSYVILENLKFDTNDKTVQFRYKTSSLDHACIRNSEFSGPGTNAGNNAVIVVSGTSSAITKNIVIYNNIIHDFGDKNSATENDYHGILPANYASDIWVLNNEIYNVGGDSIQVGQATYTSAERPNNVYIGNNVFHDDRENAVDIKSSQNVIVSSNKLYGYKASSSSSGEIVVIHNDPDNVWIINNTIHNGLYGIITTGSTNTWFIGNLIYNIHYDHSVSWNPTSLYATGAAMHFRGSSNGGALNNTIYDYDIGLEIPQGNAQGYKIENNIFSNRFESSGMDINLAGTTLASNSTLDYNAFYNSSTGIIWGSGTQYTVDGAKSKLGVCLNCQNLTATPFNDATNKDFTLKLTSSTVINVGVTDSAYSTFSTLYSRNIDKDLIGNNRFTGKAVDFGAIEYNNAPSQIKDVIFNK